MTLACCVLDLQQCLQIPKYELSLSLFCLVFTPHFHIFNTCWLKNDVTQFSGCCMPYSKETHTIYRDIYIKIDSYDLLFCITVFFHYSLGGYFFILLSMPNILSFPTMNNIWHPQNLLDICKCFGVVECKTWFWIWNAEQRGKRQTLTQWYILH